MKNAKCSKCKQAHNIFIDICPNCGHDVSLHIDPSYPLYMQYYGRTVFKEDTVITHKQAV